MTVLTRLLITIGTIEAVVIATIYIASDWRRDKVGWFLALLGGSLAWLLVWVMVGWFVHLPVLIYLPGIIGLDAALGLQLYLMLRRRVRGKEAQRE